MRIHETSQARGCRNFRIEDGKPLASGLLARGGRPFEITLRFGVLTWAFPQLAPTRCAFHEMKFFPAVGPAGTKFMQLLAQQFFVGAGFVRRAAN